MNLHGISESCHCERSEAIPLSLRAQRSNPPVIARPAGPWQSTPLDLTSPASYNQQMPTISMFYGILVSMFFEDTDRHHLAHIHVRYAGEKAAIAIIDGRVLAGEHPYPIDPLR